MTSTRKFYKNIITYEVLSEEPIGSVSLGDIEYETREGNWSGHFIGQDQVELTAQQAAEHLQNQGSDPGFFQLDAEGNDVE